MLLRKLAAAGILLLSCVSFGAGLSSDPFSPLASDPIVDGIRLSQVSPTQYWSYQEENPAEKILKVDGIESRDRFAVKEVAVNPDPGSELLTEALQNRFLSGKLSLEEGLSAGTGSATILDPSRLGETVQNLSCFTGDAFEPCVDAQVVWNGWCAEIIPEEVGCEPDYEGLVMALVNVANSERHTVNLEANDLYVKPDLKETSARIAATVERMENAAATTLTHEIGWWEPTLDVYTFGDSLSADHDGNIQVDTACLTDYYTELSEDYGLYASREEAMQEKRQMEGYLIDVDAAVSQAKAAIESGESQWVEFDSFEITGQEVARMLAEEKKDVLDKIRAEKGDDFIYIDIDSQFMWFFKDGEPLVATSVTTGTKDVYDTPTGDYALESKSTSVTLTGDNGDGTSYASFVNFWLPFDGPYGIHDASWRSEYGGEHYLYAGSHGCVNTPYDAVATIFENIEEGTPVIVA